MSLRINHHITAAEVRVLDKNGAEVGVMKLADAQKLAWKDWLDLVEVVPEANPPVCQVLDYGALKKEENRKLAETAESSVKPK